MENKQTLLRESLGSTALTHMRNLSFTVLLPDGSNVISMPADWPGWTVAMRGLILNAPTVSGSVGKGPIAIASGS